MPARIGTMMAGSEFIPAARGRSRLASCGCSIVIDVDVVYVNLDECTAFCSDGITRPFYEMYDAWAEPTQDPDEAMVAVVKIADGKFIMLGLVEDAPVSLH